MEREKHSTQSGSFGTGARPDDDDHYEKMLTFLSASFGGFVAFCQAFFLFLFLYKPTVNISCSDTFAFGVLRAWLWDYAREGCNYGRNRS